MSTSTSLAPPAVVPVDTGVALTDLIDAHRLALARVLGAARVVLDAAATPQAFVALAYLRTTVAEADATLAKMNAALAEMSR